MLTRRNLSCDVRSLLSILILGGFITGCAPTLVGPIEPNSSLVIGRVIINNKYSGAFYGLLPLGKLDRGLEVEIESLDGKQSFKVIAEEQGYFFVPNIAPNRYHLLRVTIEGSREGTRRETEKHGIGLRRLVFTPVEGKVAYIGTLVVDLSERGTSTIRELREDDQTRGYFRQKYGASLWASREFTALGARPIPGIRATQEKASQTVESKPIIRIGLKPEKPEWKAGYEWRYSWKGPKGSGTLTREIVREDAFEGVPSYVMRAAKTEYHITKDSLGELASISEGRLAVKRDLPYEYFSWPLEVGREWRNSFLSENVQEKSSRTFDLRMVVGKIEEMKVPAGTFEAFKIETYDFYSGNLVAERWYSPDAKWFIKLRIYLREGLREEELISFKVD